jgi:hypothetical protein
MRFSLAQLALLVVLAALFVANNAAAVPPSLAPTADCAAVPHEYYKDYVRCQGEHGCWAYCDQFSGCGSAGCVKGPAPTKGPSSVQGRRELEDEAARKKRGHTRHHVYGNYWCSCSALPFQPPSSAPVHG